MLTDNNREFIAGLPREQARDLYGRVLLHASRRLRRYAGVDDTEVTRDVANGAYQRLFEDSKKVCWDEYPPTTGGLFLFLTRRVDDLVSAYSRKRKRARSVAHKVGQFSSSSPGDAESQIYSDEIQQRWLEAAFAKSEKLWEFLVECMEQEPGCTDSDLAARCDVSIDRLYRLRSQSKELFERILFESEVNK